MNRHALNAAVTVALAVGLAGCMVSPDYRRPKVTSAGDLPKAFSGDASLTNAGEWKVAGEAVPLRGTAWWELFADAELTRLVALAEEHNQQLAESSARFAEARALINVARADYFPHVNAGSGFTRQRTSRNVFDNGGPAGVSHTFNNFNLSLDASWEVDLWGRVRRQVESARARLHAADDDLAAARLAIQSEVATDYFMLRSLDAELALLKQTVEAYQRSLELTRNRRKGGIATDLDVSQAETQLKSTEAQIPAIELQSARLRHALAVLCGQPATGFVPDTSKATTGARVDVPVALPSELLERRPDIAAAERRMAAANADVGVAQTAFYPRVVFHGLAGFQSLSASTWFDWPSRVWAIGPSLEVPLFTGGRNRAQLDAARAGYDATVAGYRQTVLVAFQEVEDQLAAQRLLAAELAAEQAAMESARRTLEVANNRYKSGLVTYLEVATAQSAALDRERTVVRLQSEQRTAQVALVKALGGGWHNESATEAAAGK